MADYVSPIFNTGGEVDEALVAGLNSKAALVEIIDSGAKNCLPIASVDSLKQLNTYGTWNDNVYTHSSGVVFTVNEDLTITVNGTASGANAVFILSMPGGFSIEEGEWVLSGCPSGGSSSTYNITIAGTVSDTGESANFTAVTSKLIRLYILDGTTADNLLFKPMICSKVNWEISKKYQPWRPSYEELYAMVQDLQNNGGNSVQTNTQSNSGLLEQF